MEMENNYEEVCVSQLKFISSTTGCTTTDFTEKLYRMDLEKLAYR